MASVTLTSFDPALKQLYRDTNVQKTTYYRRPILGMLPKFEGFGGRNMPVVLLYGNPQGRSAVFSTAQTNASSVQLEDFLLTRVNDYSVATIDGEVAEASVGNNMAFLSAMKTQIDTAMAALADSIESALPRSGTGSLGTIGAVTLNVDGTDDRLTLTNIENITNFEVNMVLVASAADGGALNATPASATVTKIDRTNGYVQVTDIGGASDWTAGDFLYVQGDAAAGGANVKLSGFNAWLPDSVTATAFFGVDRTTDSRLSGQVHDASTQTIEEGLIDATSKAAREGGAPDCAFIHHVQMRRLIKELGSKKEYCETYASNSKGLMANVGYKGVRVIGDNGDVDVIAANKVQATKAWVLEKKTWSLNTLGNATKFLMLDGNRILRQSTSDGYEVRLGFRGNLSTKAPIYSVNVTLPTP